MSSHVSIRLTRIEQSPEGRLLLQVANDPRDVCRFIYRAAAEIVWDADTRTFTSPRPELGPAAAHFQHEERAVRDEFRIVV